MNDFKKREPVTLFTSECVGVGHPDKISDYISDSIVTAILREDPKAHIAAECTCYDTGVLLMGEVTTTAKVNYEQIVRDAVTEIGYIHKDCPFNAEDITIENHIHEQSPDINLGTNDEVGGAGDQGMMFGGACTETTDYMPLPITIARALIVRATEYINEHIEEDDPVLRPDTKAQVTVAYGRGHVPKYVDTVVFAASHSASVTTDQVRDLVMKEIIAPVLHDFGYNPADVAHVYINGTGSFAAPWYGPYGDSGLTGRKIIVDTYGGSYSHGGGAFSSKDPSKVDRTGAYYARKIAKTIVAAGYATNCQVQLAYCIGIAKPVSINLQCYGTNTRPVGLIAKAVNTVFDCRPNEMKKEMRMCTGEIDYAQLSVFGHFGEHNPNYLQPWEDLDKVEALREYVEANYRPVEQ